MNTALCLPERGAVVHAAPEDAADPGPRALQPFALGDVRLMPGPLLTAQDRGGRYLLSLLPERLLHRLRVKAGLRPARGEARGPALGRYLSACSMMAAATARPEYQRRVAHIVAELVACQRASGGRLPRVLADCEEPLHEMRAGLHDAHRHAGSAAALDLLGQLGGGIDEAGPQGSAARLRPVPGDAHEHSLLNDLLAAQDPAACMEDHARCGDSVYFHDGDGALVVNLFAASVLHWAEQGLRIRQLTNFPEQDSTRLLVQEAPRTRMAIRLRHPGWCRQATVTVNGRRHGLGQQPGAFVEIERTWRRGDEIVLQLPMHLRLQRLPAASHIASLMFGPVVLAARMDPGADMPRLALRGRELEQLVQRHGGWPLAFSVAALELAPLHRVAHERCSLYWRLDR